MVWNYQNADCSLRKIVIVSFIIIFGTRSFFIGGWRYWAGWAVARPLFGLCGPRLSLDHPLYSTILNIMYYISTVLHDHCPLQRLNFHIHQNRTTQWTNILRSFCSRTSSLHPQNRGWQRYLTELTVCLACALFRCFRRLCSQSPNWTELNSIQLVTHVCQ